MVEKEDAGAAVANDAEAEREHLASITRYSSDAIIGLDADENIRSWNHGAEDTFGYSAEETLGRDIRFLVPEGEEAQQAHEAYLWEFRRRGVIKNHQTKLRGKDGRTVMVSVTQSMLRDPTGNELGSSLIFRDVTMEVLLKELIEHQLRSMQVTHEIGDLLHSTRSLEEILQLILVGVTAGQGLGFNRSFLLLVDEEAEGGPRLRGKMAIGPSNPDEANRIWSTLAPRNLNLIELYQAYQEEKAGKDEVVQEIVRALDFPLADAGQVFVQSILERRARNVLRGVVLGDDQPVDQGLLDLLQCDSFAVVPLETRERAIGVLVVDNCITQIAISDADLQMLKVFANHAGVAIENSRLRSDLERRLEQLAQLNRDMKENQARLMQAERLSVIGELAARVVHEVRNPLVAIGGFARLVRKGLEEDDPRSDYLRIISDEVARLERIIQELLDYSRPQQRLELRETVINDLVHEIVVMATVEAEGQGVRVTESYDASLDVVTVDPDKLRQTLLNIIRNALDVMEAEGELSISTEAVEEGRRFRVTIGDTGPGIPEDKREEVFEPGFTTRSDGTGFGLAIGKRLVELQGGQISLREFVAGEGCTFDIIVPCRVDLEEKCHEFRADGPHPHPDRG